MAGEESIVNQESCIPQIQSSILTSFLDDSNYVELCCDDERLRVVIQSLEAEINPILMNDQGNYIDEEQISISESSSTAPVHEDNLDFMSWMDVEILSSSPCSSSSSSDVNELSWYHQVSGDDDELDMSYNMIGYSTAVSTGDYSTEMVPLDMEMVMEEHNYSSLWQENYDL